MEYFKSTKIYKYPTQNVTKVHIKKDETNWMCGLRRKPEFEKIDSLTTETLCLNCSIAAGLVDKDRQETLKSFIVRNIGAYIGDIDPDTILEALGKGCKAIEDQLKGYQVKCFLETEYDFQEEIVGKIVIEVQGMRFFIRFTYKKKRKTKMHFESASRNYLSLPVDYVFNHLEEPSILF